MKIYIINGPNLNKLGKRNPDIYGSMSPDVINAGISSAFPNDHIIFFQSNSEGDIIDTLQKADEEADGVIINPGAYAHYSYAIADAIADMHIPAIEVHISNIHAREPFRATSVTARAATAVITGCGTNGYHLAMHHMHYLLKGGLQTSENQ